MAGYLFVVQLDVPSDVEEEFNRLYDEEHVPTLLTIEGVSNARRYELVDGDADMPRYATFYDVASPDIPNSEEWHRRATTPDYLRLRRHRKRRGRGTFRRIL